MEAGIKTLKMAVIGDPIDHSMSPFMHSCIIEEHGIDAVYLPFKVTGDETGIFNDAAKYLGFSGYNATMPHKVNLVDLVDEIDEEAAVYGAVNTVRIRDGKAKGFNTDARGLIAALNRRDADIKGSDIMIIGAGGAAGSIVRGFDRAGAASITVLNRTVSKAETLASSIGSGRSMLLNNENLSEAASSADIIVNCTPMGMSGMAQDFEDLSFLDDTRALVCDLIYNPWETRFLSEAEKRGLKTMNGLDMLIFQGILAFEIFTDITLDKNAEFEMLYPLCRDKLNK